MYAHSNITHIEKANSHHQHGLVELPHQEHLQDHGADGLHVNNMHRSRAPYYKTDSRADLHTSLSGTLPRSRVSILKEHLFFSGLEGDG
ncbi:hypothetical protein FQN60_006933 [Etheostoma spectabile]|uniref:Uncharacterized protein n=1 Tax=Etheostoma spectabile TaxID=54343 RepID=A0A5J5CI33_9PERO|nr:hypothetical protein FQN60_006933 [Etheostoma spectabile]